MIEILSIENPNEELIRDSEKVRIIQSFIENTAYGPTREDLCCILGIQVPEADGTIDKEPRVDSWDDEDGWD